MKIVFYLPGLVDGGAERVMADLAIHFKAMGNDVLFAVDFSASKNSPELEEPGISFVELGGGHFSTTRKLAELLIRERPDVVVTAIACASFKLTVAAILARTIDLLRLQKGHRRPRLVLTYHGFEEYKTGWMSWLGFVTLPFLTRYADSTVAVSDSLRDNLVNKWRANRRKLVRIYNPVALPRAPEGFDPRLFSGRENLILSVGRLIPSKGFGPLIEAFSKLEDKTVRLTILGEGPLRPQLLQLAEKLGVADRVDLPGYQRRTGPFYARAKCFALISRAESFGLVLVEALGYGLPVIALNDGGPREVLDGGTYGVLLERQTADEITPALQQALTDPGDPEIRLQRANHFSRESGYRQYGELFAALLNAK